MLINNLLNFTPINQVNPILKSVGYPRISFGNQITNDTVDLSFSRGLNKLKDFSIEEYNTLTDDEIQALRLEHDKLSTRTTNKIENLQSVAAESIKNGLDEMYGNDNYCVITIGRSLSSIGKVLGYKIGEDNVVNVPLSNGNQYNIKDYVEELKENGEIDKFGDFLATKGLTKEKIENSEKKYIIMDYCVSGNSLEGAYSLLSRDDLLGKSIIPMSVKDCMDINSYKTLKSHFYMNDFKDYSFVDKAYYLDDISNAYIKPDDAEMRTRLGWFALLDNEMNK